MTVPNPQSQDKALDRYEQVKHVTLVGAVVNVVLAIGKILLGFVGQSQALIADGVHSLADLISDFVVLYAAKHGQREADEEHPYGHGRIETVMTVALGIFLILVAMGITTDTIVRLMHPDELLEPSFYALIAALTSIVLKEALFQYTIHVANKIHSNLLKANAWHHRSDAISSVIAVVGIGGSMLGFTFFDAAAAIGVSILIAKVGWDISWQNLQELVDTAVEPEKVDEIRDAIMGVSGVRAVHSLRTRSVAGQTFIDVHILVHDSKMSVSEGHHISERVLHLLKHSIKHVGDVTVHIDPEDDEEAMVSTHLPLRQTLLARLDRYWEHIPQRKNIEKTTFHYLDGKVSIEITLPIETVASIEEAKSLREQLSRAVTQDKDIRDVVVGYI